MCGLKWVKASVSKTFFLNPNTFFAKQKKETIAREKGKQENEKDSWFLSLLQIYQSVELEYTI